MKYKSEVNNELQAVFTQTLYAPEKELVLPLAIPEGISSISLEEDVPHFGVSDERQLIFVQHLKLTSCNAYLRFKPSQYGIANCTLTGYNTKQELLFRYRFQMSYRKKPRPLSYITGVLLLVLLGTLGLYTFIHRSTELDIIPKDLMLHPQDTLFVGSTEAYIDVEMLQLHLEAYMPLVINSERYRQKSLPELYRLLNEGKIGAITAITVEDSLSLCWSDPFQVGECRFALPNTSHNRRIIADFNNR